MAPRSRPARSLARTVVAASLVVALLAQDLPPADITPVEVETLQKAWGTQLVKVAGLMAMSPERAREEATSLVNDLYGHEYRQVFFKPPVAAVKPYRFNRAGVVSALVGQSDEFPQDVGFAKRGWNAVRFENAGISLVGGEAMAMGNYYFTDPLDNNETKLEYTFAFFRDPKGKLRINLHFSSEPYTNASNITAAPGAVTQSEVEAAQKVWADSIVEIGEYRRKEWHYHERTNMFVDSLFAFELGTVLFRPAEAIEHPFRTTREGAISWFRGGNTNFPEDTGFALRPWTSVAFRNTEVVLLPTQAWAVGVYACEDADGRRREAVYSMGYIRDAKGALRINLLHESQMHDLASLASEKEPTTKEITVEAIEAVQHAWSNGVIQVGAQKTFGGDYKARTAELVDNIYAYSIRPTMFKPAQASQSPFRLSRDGAISYFAAGDRRFPEDSGFALNSWKVLRFDNVATIISERQALVIGHSFATGAGGGQNRGDFTMGLVLDKEGVLRVNLHHESYQNRSAVTSTTAAPRAPVTLQQVAEAQQLWVDGVIEIGQFAKNTTLARNQARIFVDKLYGYSEGPVLFKPTQVAAESRFRLTRAGAISYYAGGDQKFPEDRGFAMRPWTKIRFENIGVGVQGDRAQAMGAFFLSSEGSAEMRLDFSFGYFRDVDGRLRIDLHHMNIPYAATYNSTWDIVVTDARGFERAMGSGLGTLFSGSVTFSRSKWFLPVLAVVGVGVVVVYFMNHWGVATKAGSSSSPWRSDPGASGASTFPGFFPSGQHASAPPGFPPTSQPAYGPLQTGYAGGGGTYGGRGGGGFPGMLQAGASARHPGISAGPGAYGSGYPRPPTS